MQFASYDESPQLMTIVGWWTACSWHLMTRVSWWTGVPIVSRLSEAAAGYWRLLTAGGQVNPLPVS
ncbi:hypothetical protein GOP47_0026630 [Adiantum capillus-veneris]|nr:hypothetical protein GOP47_0026630 [Adiantum capillus-veneris]